MLAEPKYRTFDELLDSVKLDLKGYDLEGVFEPQNLIKVAMRVNEQLGIRINTARSKVLNVDNFKTRLPEDLKAINFVLVCDYTASIEEGDYRLGQSYTDGLIDGVYLGSQTRINQYTITMDIVPGNNPVTHNLNTSSMIVQATLEDGQVIGFDYTVVDSNSINIVSDAVSTVTDVKIVIIGAPNGSTIVNEGNAELVRDASGEVMVKYANTYKTYNYKHPQLLTMKKHKALSTDCVNLRVRTRLQGQIHNNFLEVNFQKGVVFVNYQSLMEDDQGNLLVLDHPLVNDYYEYALKERLLENLYMSDESVVNKYSLIAAKLREAKIVANGFVNTPDFGEMKEMWELNRKAQIHNYYSMFKSQL